MSACRSRKKEIYTKNVFLNYDSNKLSIMVEITQRDKVGMFWKALGGQQILKYSIIFLPSFILIGDVSIFEK